MRSIATGSIDATRASIARIDAAIEEDEKAAAAKAARFATITALELDAVAGPVLWMIKKILPARGMGCLIGPPGAGKSFLLLSWAFHIAIGLPWNGFRTRRGRVLYIAAEGQDGMRNRVRALRQCGLDISGAQIEFLTRGIDFFGAECNELAQHFQDIGKTFDFICVDTLHRVSGGGNENSAQDFGKILASAELLREKTGCGFLIFAHHPGWGDKTRVRGTSAMLAAWDCEWLMTREEKGAPYILSNTKTKDGGITGEDNFEIKLKVVELLNADGSPMLDIDGDAVTSCVIETKIADVADVIKDGMTLALLAAIREAPNGVSRQELKAVLETYNRETTGKTMSNNNLNNHLKRRIDEEGGLIPLGAVRVVGDGAHAVYYAVSGATGRKTDEGYYEF
jgi:hypothetical protein